MPRFTRERVLRLAAVVWVTGACSDSGGPSNAQLNFNVATQAIPAAPARASLAVLGTPETFTDGTNTLIIDGVQLVLREIELHRAGVTADCADGINDDCEELEVGPVLVDLPLGAPGGARQFSVQLPAGSYDRVEFEIHKPSDDSDPSFVQENPSFRDVSVRVTGTYNGESFIYLGDFNADMEFNLAPELVVGEAAATELTLFADLDPWFRDQSGSLIHPNSANAGGANESLVEESIKNSMDAFEDGDHDGRDD